MNTETQLSLLDPPPENKVEASLTAITEDPPVVEVAKKKRSRKPKPKPEVAEDAPPPEPKKRGRKPKPKPEVPEDAPPPEPKKRGRKPKPKPEVPIDAPRPEPKKRGRKTVPKPPKLKREPVDKKKYMREYYHKKKSCFTCQGCSQTFTYMSSLKHHTETNGLCLMKRVGATWQSLKEHEAMPTTYAPYVSLIEEELARMRKLVENERKAKKKQNDLKEKPLD